MQMYLQYVQYQVQYVATWYNYGLMYILLCQQQLFLSIYYARLPSKLRFISSIKLLNSLLNVVLTGEVGAFILEILTEILNVSRELVTIKIFWFLVNC